MFDGIVDPQDAAAAVLARRRRMAAGRRRPARGGTTCGSCATTGCATVRGAAVPSVMRRSPGLSYRWIVYRGTATNNRHCERSEAISCLVSVPRLVTQEIARFARNDGSAASRDGVSPEPDSQNGISSSRSRFGRLQDGARCRRATHAAAARRRRPLLRACVAGSRTASPSPFLARWLSISTNSPRNRRSLPRWCSVPAALVGHLRVCNELRYRLAALRGSARLPRRSVVKITTRCHSVRFLALPDARSFQVSLVARSG